MIGIKGAFENSLSMILFCHCSTTFMGDLHIIFTREYDKKKAEAELLAKRRATTPSPKPTTPILGGGFDAYIKLLKINLQQDISENHDKHEN